VSLASAGCGHCFPSLSGGVPERRLTRTVRVEEDAELKRHFLGRLQEQYGQSKEGFFVTDFVYCLRKAYWRRVKPRLFSERQLGYFVDGSRRHEALQSLSGFRSEVSVEKHGVRGRMDLFAESPIEVKTTRASSRSGIPLHYLRQCAYYCVLSGNHACTLVTQHVVEGCFKFQRLTFSVEELVSYERELVENRRLLEEALTKQDHSGLPVGESWQCRNCEYRRDCDSLEHKGTKHEEEATWLG
jgi:CRISPR/Cas system-associated exonuclease Cas4 (RecB family)